MVDVKQTVIAINLISLRARKKVADENPISLRLESLMLEAQIQALEDFATGRVEVENNG